MELSKRLKAVADLVTEGASVADIGTDHGYIPIYLIENKICSHAVAMDINRGPLEKAGIHIREKKLDSFIETRLSDGLEKLRPGEADTVIAAGMGGGLILRILDSFPQVTESVREFILQPQSEIGRLRRELNREGFRAVAENMVEEDGKFYPMMKMIRSREPQLGEAEYRYGKLLLTQKNPVLLKFLLRERKIKQKILKELAGKKSVRTLERIQELQEDIRWIDEALSVY